MLGKLRDHLSASIPRSAFGGLAFFCALVTPVLIAIWFVPWFVTQDGPVHLYNAHILSELSKGTTAFQDAYAVRSGLLPYVGTYKVLAGLMAVFSPRVVDRIAMTITSVGFAWSVIWLRARVAGWTGMIAIVPLVVIIAFTRLWLLGLYGFLFGACLFTLALGLWWKWRDNLRPLFCIALSILLAIGFFVHIVSTTVTAVGLVVLAVATPTRDLQKRLIQIGIILLPSLCLAIWFAGVMSTSGSGGLDWIHLNDPWSVSNWLRYLQEIDFISISFKTVIANALLISTDLPFSRNPSSSFAVLSPSLWALIGTVALTMSTLDGSNTLRRIRTSTYRGWVVITLGLFGVAAFGPGGAGQGATILRERLLLLGLVALVAILRFDLKKRLARAGVFALTLAAILQIAFIWDYALISNQIASEFMTTARHVESRQRVSFVMADTRTWYLVNPLPNLTSQLGIGTNAIVWNNYGPAYYYFPVSFKNAAGLETWRRLGSINDLLKTSEAEQVAKADPAKWMALSQTAFADTDLLVLWGSLPWFEATLSRTYAPEPFLRTSHLILYKREAKQIHGPAH
jgi:hypothetical protein